MNNIPDFASWQRENLEQYATEAYEVINRQRELIQHLRRLIATVPEKNPRQLQNTQ